MTSKDLIDKLEKAGYEPFNREGVVSVRAEDIAAVFELGRNLPGIKAPLWSINSGVTYWPNCAWPAGGEEEEFKHAEHLG